MKTIIALISGVILFSWFIFCPVPGWAKDPEAPKAASANQPITEPATNVPAPSPPHAPGELGKPTPPAPGEPAKPTSPPSLEPAKALNVTELAKGLDWNLMLILLLTVATGGVGGIVYELLILQGNIELPHTPDSDEITEKFPYAIPKHLYDLGIFARVIIGATAALAALLVLSPTTTITLLATSLVAGSAGTSVFRSIQDRLLAALAQKNAADTQAKLTKVNTVNTQALGKINSLKTGVSAAAPGAKALTGIGIDDLDEIEKLLSEAKGLGS